MDGLKLGIYGGTFDPPHFAHLVLAGEAQFQLGLARVLWVLTPTPPHKQQRPVTAVAARLALLEAAIAGNPQFAVSRIEIDRPAPHYAADTLLLLRAQFPQAELVYLMGGDSLHDLPTWQRPSQLLAGCDLLGVMRRPADAVDLPALERLLPGLSAKVRFIAAPELQISASEIRRRAAAGEPFRYYLPERVYDLILAGGLYPPASEGASIRSAEAR